MKRLFTILTLGAIALSASAQESVLSTTNEAAKAMSKAQAKVEEPEEVVPSNWQTALKIDLGFDQTALFNWAAGGYNTAAVRSALDFHLDYTNEMTTWKNRLQLEYGFLYSSDKPWPLIQKNSDLMYLESKFAYQASKDAKWKYTASFDFRSQFAPGYEYKTPGMEEPTIDDWKNARILKSDLFSPAYTNLALGIEWIPASWLDINFAPLTGGFTIVQNPLLRKSYSMSLKSADLDPEFGDNYKPAMFQFGAQLKADIKFVVNKNFKFESQLVLFTDYLHEPYIRANWDNKIEWQISRLFKIGLNTWLIYDPWVKMPDGSKRGVQFKESSTISFTYSLAPQLKKHPHRHHRAH